MGLLPSKGAVLPRQSGSGTRHDLQIMNVEGIPATVIGFLLGGALQTSYLLHLGASSVQVGIALAIPQLANLVQIIGALVMQNYENRRLAVAILAGLHRTLWVATGAIPFLFPEHLWIPVYLLLVTISFISNSLGAVVWTSMVADIVPPSVRGNYFGFRNMFLNGIGSLVLYAGGKIVDTFSGGSGFTILFAVSALMVVWNIVMLLLYPNPPFEKSKETNQLRLMKKPFQDPTFLKSMLFIAMWLLLQCMAIPMFSYAMLEVLELNVQWVTAVSIAQTVAMMASFLMWGRLNSRYSARTLLFWTLPIISGSCLLWGVTGILPTLVVLFAVHILVGVGTGGFNMLMFNFSIGDTPKSDRPMFIGIFSALTGLAAFVGSILGGYLFEWTAGAPEWVQSKGIFTILGAVLLVAGLTIGSFALRDRSTNSHVDSSDGSLSL